MAQGDPSLPSTNKGVWGLPNTYRLSSLASGAWRSLQTLWKVTALFAVGKYSPGIQPPLI